MNEAVHRDVRARLEALEGVVRVLVGDEGEVWIVVSSETAASAVRREAAGMVEEAFGAPATVHIVGGVETRVLFERVEREVLSDGTVRIRAVLSWRGAEYSGEVVGDRGEPLEIRTAANAALRALDAVAGRPLGLRLVGLKQMRAFDADLMIVSIWSSESPPRHLIGSVAVTAGSLHAAGISVLDACNRFLGSYLSRTD